MNKMFCHLLELHFNNHDVHNCDIVGLSLIFHDGSKVNGMICLKKKNEWNDESWVYWNDTCK